MNLINKAITHKVFGEGQIVDHDDSFITVNFDEGTKKFVFPDAFGKYIKLKDEHMAQSLNKMIEKTKMHEAELKRKQEAEKQRQVLEQQRREKLKKLNIHECSQIVFWLDEEELEDVFSNWQVSTGTIQSGKNKGQPNRAARLRPNSVALLTTRRDDEKETDRQIKGLFMVSDIYTGHLDEDGIVPAHPTYRLKLTDEESEQMLFWNYYINKNFPHRTAWNSGRFRYYDNIWTAQILKDLIALKSDEEEVNKLKKFLEYFCQLNALDIDNIPEPYGALKQE